MLNSACCSSLRSSRKMNLPPIKLLQITNNGDKSAVAWEKPNPLPWFASRPSPKPNRHSSTSSGRPQTSPPCLLPILHTYSRFLTPTLVLLASSCVRPRMCVWDVLLSDVHVSGPTAPALDACGSVQLAHPRCSLIQDPLGFLPSLVEVKHYRQHPGAAPIQKRLWGWIQGLAGEEAESDVVGEVGVPYTPFRALRASAFLTFTSCSVELTHPRRIAATQMQPYSFIIPHLKKNPII